MRFLSIESGFCSTLKYFYCSAGEGDANREAGDSEMDTQSEKTRLPPAGPEDWDGPSESLSVTSPSGRI